jgi:phage terminase large subunit-like protein
MRPTVLNFSEPMKQLDGLIRAGKIEHDGDPVMTWMVGNVVAYEDAKRNVYPRRENRQSKIDGVVALLSALARDMAAPSESSEISVYERLAVEQPEVAQPAGAPRVPWWASEPDGDD